MRVLVVQSVPGKNQWDIFSARPFFGGAAQKIRVLGMDDIQIKFRQNFVHLFRIRYRQWKPEFYFDINRRITENPRIIVGVTFPMRCKNKNLVSQRFKTFRKLSTEQVTPYGFGK